MTAVLETRKVPAGCGRVGMDETYRMLGREREVGFEKEAVSRRLAAAAREQTPKPRSPAHGEERKARWAPLRARIASLLLTPSRRHEARDVL